MSSSMAESFTSHELVKHSSTFSKSDNKGSTSVVCTIAIRHNPQHPLDCVFASLVSNVPSLIIKDGHSMFTHEGCVGCISKEIDLDVKPSLDEACFSDTCRQHSTLDDMFISRLDELL